MKRKKIGYTLTELLVVVMIVAVLSAVVLPKFNKVLETRKTSEAEDLMTAVRQEQEYRCASDRPYATEANALQSLASAKTKNYTLSLTEEGIEAARGGKNYTLKILSYADGRICCEGSYCAELNKDYPSCEDMSVKASPTSCVVESSSVNDGTSGSECTDGEKQYDACGPTCDRGNKLVRECVDGEWQARNGQCLNASGGEITNHECSCEYYSGTKPADTTASCFGCGTRTVSYACSGAPNWKWTPSNGTCHYTQDESITITKEADCPKCYEDKRPGMAYDRCLDDHYGEAGVWHDDICACQCPPGYELNGQDMCEPIACYDEQQDKDMCINPDYIGDYAGTWDDNTCSCDCGVGGYWDHHYGCVVSNCDWGDAQECEQGHHGTGIPGTYDWERCQCNCPEGTALWQGLCMESDCPEDSQYWAQDIDACEKRNNYNAGLDPHEHVPGIWDPTICECRCLKGSHSADHHHTTCVLNSGQDEQEFYDEYDDCWGGTESDCSTQDDIWDEYDEGMYDDWYDDYYDDWYDDYDMGWDW